MNSANVHQPIGFGPWEISSMVNEEVVQQYVENASFLWVMRDHAVQSPKYTLKDVTDLDERVEAHLDGLRIAGQRGWEICEEALSRVEPGLIFLEPGLTFAAGVLAFSGRDADQIEKVLHVGCSEPELEHTLISALGWLSFDQAEGFLKKLLGSEFLDVRRVVIAGYAVHRRDPGPPLLQAILDRDVRIRACALKAAGELGRLDLLPTIRQSISDDDDYCRFFAAWSAARLGDRSATVLKMLQEIAQAPSWYQGRALDMALRCMELPHAKAWCQHLRDNPKMLRLAAIGAGVIGDPELNDDLITLMESEAIARVAGEAFSMITGVDLSYEDLDGDQPEGYKGGPSDNPEDEDVAMDQDEDLPWPVPSLVAQWWKEHGDKFRAGVRYLRGKELAGGSLRQALLQGNQRQRAAAALELALRESTKPLFEVRAPGGRQLIEMNAWTS
jgi:uncharacterized protein (TIGR02270 family)